MKKLFIVFFVSVTAIVAIADNHYCDSCVTPRDYAEAGLRHIGFTQSYADDYLDKRRETVIENRWTNTRMRVLVNPVDIGLINRLKAEFSLSFGSGGVRPSMKITLNKILKLDIYVGTRNPPIRMSKAEALGIMNPGATKYPTTRRAPPNRFSGWGGGSWSGGGSSGGSGPTGRTGPAGGPDAGQKGPNYSDCRSCANQR